MLPLLEGGKEDHCQRQYHQLQGGLCHKFAVETIDAMISPGDLRCTQRENNDDDQFQGSPFSAEIILMGVRW